MIPVLIGFGIGLLAAKLTETFSEKENKEKGKNSFFVFVRSEKYNKSILFFNNYESAKSIFDKISKYQEVLYKDIVEFSVDERKLYEKWKKEGNIGKEGFPSGLSDKSSVQEVSFGQNDSVFEKKTFKKKPNSK